MATVRVLVLRAPGVNCDEETAFAWRSVGAVVERMHVKRLISEPHLLDGFQILTIPGGFSYGDDIASGKILANQLAHHLRDATASILERGGLVLGICNGFQVLVRLGLLPGPDCGVAATLTLNDSGRYEDRWVGLAAAASPCVFLEPGEQLCLPVAHAEGKFMVGGGGAGLAVLEERQRVALRYVAAGGREPQYPENPNGSIGNVAALTDETGRVLGLMPHPERNMLPTHSPEWTSDSSIGGQGARLFSRAMRHFL